MMNIKEEDLILPKLKINEINNMLLHLNPEMNSLSDLEVISLSLILFELICDAHYDKENERKKVILKALIEKDDDLFLDALKSLLKSYEMDNQFTKEIDAKASKKAHEIREGKY